MGSKKKETLYVISFSRLGNFLCKRYNIGHREDDFIYKEVCAELIGYSPRNNIAFVISDGCCWISENSWLMHTYRPKNPNQHIKEFLWYDNPPKWHYSDEELIEEILVEDIGISTRD